MFDAGEDTAPVTTVQSLVNNSVNFYINSVTTQNSVVDSTQQVEKPALLAHGRLARRVLAVTPCFGFVMRHARSLIQRLRRLPSKINGNLRSPFLCRLTQAYGICDATNPNRKLKSFLRLNVSPPFVERNDRPRMGA